MQNAVPSYAAALVAAGDARMLGKTNLSTGRALYDHTSSGVVTFVDSGQGGVRRSLKPVDVSETEEVFVNAKKARFAGVDVTTTFRKTPELKQASPHLVLDQVNWLLYDSVTNEHIVLERIYGFERPVLATPLSGRNYLVLVQSAESVMRPVMYNSLGEMEKQYGDIHGVHEAVYLAVHRQMCVLAWKQEHDNSLNLSLFDYPEYRPVRSPFGKRDFSAPHTNHHFPFHGDLAIFSEGPRIMIVVTGQGYPNGVKGYNFLNDTEFLPGEDRPALLEFLRRAPLCSLSMLGAGNPHALAACTIPGGAAHIMIIPNPLIPRDYTDALRYRELVPLAPLEGDEAFAMQGFASSKRAFVATRQYALWKHHGQRFELTKVSHINPEGSGEINVTRQLLIIPDEAHPNLAGGYREMDRFKEGEQTKMTIGGLTFSTDKFQVLDYDPEVEFYHIYHRHKWAVLGRPLHVEGEQQGQDGGPMMPKKVLMFMTGESAEHKSFSFRFPGRVQQLVLGFPGYIMLFGVDWDNRTYIGKLFLEYDENGPLPEAGGEPLHVLVDDHMETHYRELRCTYEMAPETHQIYDDGDSVALLQSNVNGPNLGWNNQAGSIFERMPITLAKPHGPRHMLVVVNVCGSLLLCLALRPSVQAESARFHAIMVGTLLGELKPREPTANNDTAKIEKVTRLVSIFGRLPLDLMALLSKRLSISALDRMGTAVIYKGDEPRPQNVNAVTMKPPVREYALRERHMAGEGKPDTWTSIYTAGLPKRNTTHNEPVMPMGGL